MHEYKLPDHHSGSCTYNILTVFFNQTPAAGFYNGTVGTNYIQYLEVPYVDVECAGSEVVPGHK